MSSLPVKNTEPLNVLDRMLSEKLNTSELMPTLPVQSQCSTLSFFFEVLVCLEAISPAAISGAAKFGLDRPSVSTL